jgi:hypothetical protein
MLPSVSWAVGAYALGNLQGDTYMQAYQLLSQCQSKLDNDSQDGLTHLLEGLNDTDYDKFLPTVPFNQIYQNALKEHALTADELAQFKQFYDQLQQVHVQARNQFVKDFGAINARINPSQSPNSVAAMARTESAGFKQPFLDFWTGFEKFTGQLLAKYGPDRNNAIELFEESMGGEVSKRAEALNQVYWEKLNDYCAQEARATIHLPPTSTYYIDPDEAKIYSEESSVYAHDSAALKSGTAK